MSEQHGFDFGQSAPKRFGRKRAAYTRRGLKLYPPHRGQPRWTIERSDGHISYCADEADGRTQIAGLCRHVARR